MKTFEENKAAKTAARFINSTNRHIFLTGKAGTGKTTFLRQIVKETHKQAVVAAPTGIAAINAEGVTLHSLFQLPFGAFIPSRDFQFSQNFDFQINTPNTFLRKFKMNKQKRDMIRQIELLIIDEVSMLRADILDAIDVSLRFLRRSKQTFAGIQILFIGDLSQLPPVVRDNEWHVLKQFYNSMFFFDSLALKKQRPIFIELEKVYRQRDESFIKILNNIRDNTLTNEDIDVLNQYYNPDFQQQSGDGYVNLTTHNYKADRINNEELDKLPEKLFEYHAVIQGNFPENSFPVEPVLELKEGAQVMFIKNDPSGEQLFFNGKIGIVDELEKDKIIVGFNDGSDSVQVSRYTWENKRYTLNKETNQIDEKEIGSFVHYPLKLAWAITVHKSQGLTFEKAIIDIAGAFAAGQVYVAISRLTSLDGLVLTSRIQKHGLEQDEALKQFNKTKDSFDDLNNEFKNASSEFIRDYTLKAFDFTMMYNMFNEHVQSYKMEENLSAKQRYAEWAVKLRNEILQVEEVANKFMKQVKRIAAKPDENFIPKLHERVVAAKNYFEPILKDFSKRTLEHAKYVRKEKRIKQYINELYDVELLFFGQLQQIRKAEAILKASVENTDFTKDMLQYKPRIEDVGVEKPKQEKKKPKEKKEKIPTKKITFDLFKQGVDIEEIAKVRALSEKTIEGHLTFYIETGDLRAEQFVEKQKLEIIKKEIAESEDWKLSPVKEKLGDDYSWRELKFAKAAMKAEEENNIK